MKYFARMQTNHFFVVKLACLYAIACACAVAEVRFEIIIPSYNNEKWCINNLQSVVQQKYHNFHVTYIDDDSTDATGALIDGFIASHHLQDLITVIHNKGRRGALENLYHSIHGCPDSTVIVTLDGDDKLAHNNVLARLNEIYSNYEVWLTYGQFRNWPTNTPNDYCLPMPPDIIRRNAFRECRNIVPSHLRTYYAWLFKRIRPDDLMLDGNFFAVDADLATMYPMIEMAGDRHAFIPEILYLYNVVNSISDMRVNLRLQSELAKFIRAKPRYKRLEGIVMNPNKSAPINSIASN